MPILSCVSRARPGAFAVLAAALAIVSSASASVERVVEKTFVVQPGGTIRVSTDSGLISVETGTDNQVKIIAHEHVLRAKSEGQADRILRGLTLDLTQTAGGVMARSQYDTGGFAQYGKAHNPVQVDFTVIVPARFAEDLRTSDGDIRVVVPAGVGYSLDAAAPRGAVNVNGVNVTAFSGGAGENQLVGRVGRGGVTLRLRSGGGNITLDHASAS